MRYLLLIILIAIALPAYSATTQEVCSHLSETAEVIAEARYNGAPMRDVMPAMMKLAEKNSRKGGEETVSKFYRALVEGAYALPAYQAPSVQQRAIREYGNRVYRACTGAAEQRHTL